MHLTVQETTDPIMCAYKLVTCQFKWWGLQGRVEKMIMNAEKRVFTKFHREVCCWIDQWYGLTLEDIRKIEEETKQILVEVSGTLKFAVCLCTYVDMQVTLAGGYFFIVICHSWVCVFTTWDQSIVIHRVLTHASVCIYSLGPLRMC